MQDTAEGFVAMIDGYNAKIIDFNEKAAAKIEREEELERLEFESAQAWVMRFRKQFNRWPNPNYFRYEKYQANSRSPRHARTQGTGALPS